MATLRQRRNPDTVMDAPGQGVGGRHTDLALPGGGGGYLDNCNNPNAPFEDAKILAILRAIRLPLLWLTVAEFLGPRKFLDLWRHLQDEGLLDPGTHHTRFLPRVSRYHRYIRNRRICELYEGGMVSSIEIAATISNELGVRADKQLINGVLAELFPDRRAGTGPR